MKVVIDIPKDFTGDYIVDKFKDFFSRVIADIDCKGMCGRYEKEIAEMFLKAFDDSEEKNTCNCQRNSNSRDNESCCGCDSKVSENDDTKNKVTSLEIIVRMIDNKPYYEIKYKKVGEDYYHVGYSSFNIDNVLKWRDECFELVDAKATRIAIKALEEVQQYRAICTPEECRAAMKKQNSTNKELESHDEKHILECCISLMQEMVNEFAEWYRWQHGEDAIEELDKEERFCFRKSYFRIVQELFLLGTTHSGGTSTRAKCEQLGVDSAEEIEFDWSDEE